ncbi:nitroreductase family protein [Candidatus Omnitrophota bacterium]
MDVLHAIAERYSYRESFKNEPISRDNLKKIVEAGLQAPSGCNAQTTTFVIVDEPDLVKKIGGMHTMKAMQNAQALICCINDVNPQAVYEGYEFQTEDCAAAVENILLTITSLGYASVWIDGWLRLENRAEAIGKMLNVPEGKIIRIILPIGIPDEKGPRKEKKPFHERAWFNTYHRTID